MYPGGSVTLKYDGVIDKWEITASHYNSLDNFGVSTIPQTAIIISETKPNSLIENSGYTLVGMTYLAKNEYSLNSFAWVGQISKTTSPTPRINHSATWTGEKMIVWGGAIPNTFYNDGRIYSPSINSWQSMSNSFLAGRKNHAAIWTGNKMIFWGGSGSNIFYNDGATYDLNTDIWSSVSVSGLSPREEPGYVWTGDKMIIWGGATSGLNTFNDGKIYDIQSNSWQNMSQVNAPIGRRRHSAIWTGDKFIVWGGETNNDFATNTGAIYDPIADTWNAITTQNAPPLGMADHSSIWTGSKMIVFGGYNNSGATITNACYLFDPFDGPNGTWSICSGINKPSVRRGHTAIWTGDKMIVFGGYDENSLNDGGIYDPVTDSWDENSIYNNNSYTEHSAIWTGEDMIVFGSNPAGDIMKKDFKPINASPHYLYKKN
ncbi:MAG: hypothetical protein IPM42_10815 [Saprospiraceae bacterium]|nr:hypothetical protein [Saprospiraceae bacterium]